MELWFLFSSPWLWMKILKLVWRLLLKRKAVVPPEVVVVLRGVLQQPVDGVLSNSSFPSDSWHYHLMEEDANVDRRWVPQTGSWEGKLFNICCLVWNRRYYKTRLVSTCYLTFCAQNRQCFQDPIHSKIWHKDQHIGKGFRVLVTVPPSSLIISRVRGLRIEELRLRIEEKESGLRIGKWGLSEMLPYALLRTFL